MCNLELDLELSMRLGRYCLLLKAEAAKIDAKGNVEVF